MLGVWRSCLLIWVLFGGILLRTGLGADCAAYNTDETCEPVDGCLWNVDHCICASEMSMDVAFLLDDSSSIGESAFQIELDWVVAILESSLPVDARIALIRFDTEVSEFMDFVESETKTTAERQAVAEAIPYDRGTTHTSKAIEAAIAMFNAQSGNETDKVIILITDGKPTVGVCHLAPTLRAMNVKVVIIGVGNWNSAEVDCLVSSPDEDMIFVPQYSDDLLDTILPVVTEVTCPVSYNLIVSEVQLDPDSNGDGSRFVEIYNQGQDAILKDVEVSGIFSGSLAQDGDDTKLSQHNYLVVYDSDAQQMPSCVDCECALDGDDLCKHATYVECCDSGCVCAFTGDSMHNKEWNVRFEDKLNGAFIDEVTYDSNTWPTIEEGYTYELKFAGFDNDDGDNWQQSCFKRGTPGHSPVANCSSACENEQCKLNNAVDANCEGGVNGHCDCSNDAGYYYADGTCKKIPMPGPCVATFLRSSQNQKPVEYVWEKAATDSAVNYSLAYFSKSGSVNKIGTQSRTYTVTDYDHSRGYDVSAGSVRTVIGTAKSEAVECWPVTLPPTTSTTPRPWEKPYFWISGDVCKEERCECAEDGDWTCDGEDVYKEYPASDAPTFVSVRKYQLGPYGEDYPWLVEVFWKLKLIDDSYEYVAANTTQPPEDGRRRLLSLLESTTEGPNTTLSDDDFGIWPREGSLLFNGSGDTEKIELMIPKVNVKEERRYRLYRLQLTVCQNDGSHGCKLVYLKKLYMEVDINGGHSFKEDDDDDGDDTPQWLWYVIAVLLVIPLILGCMAYRYWTKTKEVTSVLSETQSDLDAANEENELGFGRGAEDVKFNPLGTGVPGTGAPMLRHGTFDERKALVATEYVQENAEKFNEVNAVGQSIPVRK